MNKNRLQYVAWVRARVACALGGHQWKRAKRFLGNDGTQKCKRCAETRTVTLRPRREPR